MSVNAPKRAEAKTDDRSAVGFTDLSLLEVGVEFDDAASAARRHMVRILVDRASGRPVAVSGDVLYAYDVLEVETDLLDRGGGEAVIVEDAPLGAPTCASLWTDCELDETPGTLRLTAGRVGRRLETLVLGEGRDGGLDRSMILDVEGPNGSCRSLHGRYRIDAVRRMRPN